MTLSLRLFALWLAALWLPLTMHCQLAGLKICCTVGTCCEVQPCAENEAKCNDPACCGVAPDSHSAVCNIVETGNYFSNMAPQSVPAASSAVIAAPVLHAARRDLSLVATAVTEATGAPPGWSRVWQFVLRAAPAPRAPSAVG
ncbi:MAG: hypothetical protein WCK77_05905 [Verrucomicrobiota bacterium]